MRKHETPKIGHTAVKTPRLVKALDTNEIMVKDESPNGKSS